MKVSRAAAALTFLALLLAAELACRWLLATGAFYGRFPLWGTLTSVPEIRDRIRWGLGTARPPVIVLGDSVLGASALLSRDLPGARTATIPAALARLAAPDGARVVSLGADGLLPGDLEALASILRGAAKGRPVRVALALNVRMLAGEARAGGSLVSREFLLGALPPGRARELTSGPLPREKELARRLYGGTAEVSALFRLTQQLRTVWYHPTPRDAAQRLLDETYGRPDTGDLEEAALRLQVIGYYREAWDAGSPALLSLGRVVAALHAIDPAMVVVLTPQNPSFVEEAGPGLLAANRGTLAILVAKRAPGAFVDLSTAFAEPLFLDHCHLTPEGNARLAAELLRALGTRAGART